MKDMIYTTERKMEILFSGEYKEHKFYILNLGTHPTAYVENKFKNLSSYEDERLDNIEVHGGFTYSDGAYWDKQDKSSYLGWDYAHCYDYTGYYAKYPDTYLADAHLYNKWTTSEIWEEVKSVIEQLIVLEERDSILGEWKFDDKDIPTELKLSDDVKFTPNRDDGLDWNEAPPLEESEGNI